MSSRSRTNITNEGPFWLLLFLLLLLLSLLLVLVIDLQTQSWEYFSLNRSPNNNGGDALQVDK